jgi:DNA-binding beta-propeller fold protein YncE
MYVPATGASNITKMNSNTGEIIWTNSTGPGPYGCSVNADGSEVWIADKGEGVGVVGRTATVLDAETGSHLETLFSAYQVDHILLDPTGTEFWLTSNREGSIHVFDAQSREKLDVIEMPNAGDPHGLVWVHYDEQGNARVVADQGGFHAGIDPHNGNPLNYQPQ